MACMQRAVRSPHDSPKTGIVQCIASMIVSQEASFEDFTGWPSEDLAPVVLAHALRAPSDNLAYMVIAARQQMRWLESFEVRCEVEGTTGTCLSNALPWGLRDAKRIAKACVNS